MVDRCCQHAQRLAAGLEEAGFEILNEVVLNQVVATIGTADDLRRIAALVQEEGECWFGTTFWQGKHAIRLSVSSWATTEDDIRRSILAIKRATDQALSRQHRKP